MTPGVTTCHIYLSVGELRGLEGAWMLLRRRATPRNPRIPIVKISRAETVMGMTAAPKGAMTMSQDLMPPPQQAGNFGLNKPRYPSSRVTRFS